MGQLPILTWLFGGSRFTQSAQSFRPSEIRYFFFSFSFEFLSLRVGRNFFLLWFLLIQYNDSAHLSLGINVYAKRKKKCSMERMFFTHWIRCRRRRWWPIPGPWVVEKEPHGENRCIWWPLRSPAPVVIKNRKWVNQPKDRKTKKS